MIGNGYLTLGIIKGQRYYLIVTKPINPGEIIEIVQGGPYQIRGEEFFRNSIKASDNIKILREKHILEAGGLEVIAEQARKGELKTKGDKTE